MKILIIFFILSILNFAQTSQIFIDEFFDDWESIETFVEDQRNDGIAGVDFLKLWVTNDAKNLYIRIDIDQEINFQNDPLFWMKIDLDNNMGTGEQLFDMGADIEFNFGNRHIITLGDTNISLLPSDLEFNYSPTVSSNSFELALSLDAEVNGRKLFASDTIKVIFLDNSE